MWLVSTWTDYFCLRYPMGRQLFLGIIRRRVRLLWLFLRGYKLTPSLLCVFFFLSFSYFYIAVCLFLCGESCGVVSRRTRWQRCSWSAELSGIEFHRSRSQLKTRQNKTVNHGNVWMCFLLHLKTLVRQCGQISLIIKLGTGANIHWLLASETRSVAP